MTDLAIVTMYLLVGLTVGGAIGLGFLAINASFYAFCWAFVKIDNALQNRYWNKIQKFQQHQESLKKVA